MCKENKKYYLVLFVITLTLLTGLTLWPFSKFPNQHDTFTQVVLKKYFKTIVPKDLIHKEDVLAFSAFLKDHHFVELADKVEIDFQGSSHLFFGTVQFEKERPPHLWIYKNCSVHDGILAIINPRLEIVYLNQNMGCLSEVEVKELWQQPTLMITHGAGGTGVYSRVTDLYRQHEGIVSVEAAILKDFRECNFAWGLGIDALPCLQCRSEISFDVNQGGKAEMVIDLIATVTIDASLTADQAKVLSESLEKDFGFIVNTPKRFKGAAVIEDIDTPIIRYSGDVPVPVLIDRRMVDWPRLTLSK